MAGRTKGKEINGWLILDKPQGMGSTEAVNLTRRWFDAKKNGHCGTLDPFATGVLPIAFGEATKLVPLVTEGRKVYEFVVEWGKATNTADCEGEVCETAEKIPSKEEILQVLPEFLGKITQVPPIFSAVKINGERAYALARAGKEVDMPERIVEIFALELLEIKEDGAASFRVECSKGTYVRSLGRDLAVRLGTVGHLRALRRLKSGNFTIEDAIKLENLKNMVHSENPERVLLPLVTSLRDIAVIAVSEADAAKLAKGQSLSPKSYDVSLLVGKDALAVCGDKLAAWVRIDTRKIAPVRVFNC